jgi:hypothetical protein
MSATFLPNLHATTPRPFFVWHRRGSLPLGLLESGQRTIRGSFARVTLLVPELDAFE